MDILDTLAEPLGVIGAFAMLALIVHHIGRCIRAFIQGINDADDPRQQTSPHRHADRRRLKTVSKWALAYIISVVVLFISLISLASGGWPRVSYVPEFLFSLLVPLLTLRLLAYALRLGSMLHQRRHS
jgi:hypothetical protein